MLYFEKLHGTGNDFIIFNGIKEDLWPFSELAKKVCDRHFGIGADGMMVVEASERADIKMSFFNADGSEAPMCGNGIRCFGKYVYDNKIIDNSVFTVETLAGIMRIELVDISEEVEAVRVNMGSPVFDTQRIPVISDKESFINEEIEVDSKSYKLSSLVMGTMHTVIFVDSLEDINISNIGSAVETHPLFPQKTNVNFCEVVDKQNIRVSTWERGVGKTLACGTGSAAAAVMSSILYQTDSTVNVHVPGGVLKIEEIDGIVYMTGPAERICTGLYNIKL